MAQRSTTLVLAAIVGAVAPLLTPPLTTHARTSSLPPLSTPKVPLEQAALAQFFLEQSIQQSQLTPQIAAAELQALRFEPPQLLAQNPAQVQQAIQQIRQLRSAAVRATNEQRFQDALKSYQQILVLFTRYKYRPGMAMTLWNIGTIYHELKEYKQALQALKLAEEAVQSVNNSSLANNIQTSQRLAQTELAQQFLKQRQYDRALQGFQQGIALAKRNNDTAGQILMLLKVAEVYRAQQLYRQALPPLDTANQLAQQDEAFSQNVVLMVLGRTYDDLSEYPTALEYYEQALKLAQRERDLMQVASIINNIGTIRLNQGKYHDARRLFDQALKTAQTERPIYETPVTTANLDRLCQEAQTNPAPPFTFLKNFCSTRLPRNVLAAKTNIVFQGYWRMIATLEGNVLNNIGSAESSLGNYDRAIVQHQMSLKVHKPLKDFGRDATSWNNIGNVYLSKGQYTQALKAYQTSLKLVRQVGNRNQEASTLSNMAQVYQAQGQVKRSVTVALDALKIVRTIEDKQQEATLLSNLGSSYAALADYRKAEDMIQQGLKLHRQIGSLSGEATALNNLAIVIGQRGEYEKAIRFHKQSIAITRRIGDRHKEAANLGNLGRTYADLAQYAKGIAYYNQALTVHKSLGSQSWVLSTQANLAGMYRTLGQQDKSLALYQTVARDAGKLGESMTTGIALVGAATVLVEQGDLDAAAQALQQALKLHRQSGAKRAEIFALRTLGKLQAKQNKPQTAIATLQTALKLTRDVGPLETSLTLQDLAQLHLDQRQYRAAERNAKTAIEIAKKAPYQDIIGTSLTIIGQAQLANNQAATAIAPLNQAIQVWEGLRPGLKDSDKVSLFDTQTKTYRLLQKALVTQGRTSAGLEIAERGRARAFVELFATKTGQAKAGIKSPNLAAIKALAKQQQATLVEYSQVDDRTLYIWLVKPSGEVIFRERQLPNGSLSQMVALSRSSIGVRSRRSITSVDLGRVEKTLDTSPVINSNFKELHQILIAPIEADLPTDERQKVVFIPQGALFYVPFAALEDPQGKVLLEKHTIAIAPSIQSLELTARLKQRTPKGGRTLIVGNPKMPSIEGLDLTPLPGAEQEAKAVGSLLKTSPLLGTHATKSKVLKQMQQAKIIHLATHGLLDTFRGDVPGAIVLAGGTSTAESLLTASEIADLKLQAELVVLSACSTGKGDITGDGVIGLSRSLFLAGVPSVIVSLWDVDDAATSTLMTAFYRNWQSGRFDKAQALRQAMLETRKSHSDPNLWAAFNLVGAS